MVAGTGPDRETAAKTGFITIAPARVPKAPGEILSAAASSAEDASPPGEHDDYHARIDCGELLDSITCGAFVTDLQGRITAVNDSCCELFGLTGAELRKLCAHDLISGAEEKLLPAVLRILERKQHVLIEADMLRKDGTAFPAEIEAGSFHIAGSTRMIFVIRGSPEHRAASEAASEAAAVRKFETASTVAGQIAHDFDNLLTPLFAYPELIRRDLPEKCRSRELLDIIEKTAHDMAKITQQLLSLSKRGQHKMVVFDLNEVVQHVADLLRDGAAKRNVRISTDLDVRLMPIKGAPEQMLRVIQNLCQNSIDAIDGEGRIDLATRNVRLDKPAGRHETVGPGEYVQLTVADNGSGIPEEILEKIFDPFFTTRKTSKNRGSGLGLSVVRGIVDDHRGAIDVDSAVGKGTTFRVFFPVYREDSGGPAALDQPARRRSAVIVDDDPMQRDVLAKLLRSHDFTVTCFPSGETAVEYMARCAAPSLIGEGRPPHGGFPDVVMLDVVMDPGMDGKETCRRILEINPKQRVIMVSGYPTAEYAGGKYPSPNVSYLSKPLTWNSISSELLNNGPTAAASSGEAGARSRNRILVVDDEEGIRRLFRGILSAALPAATVDVAVNGDEAVKAFKSGRHSVIVMDLRMPVKDGQAAFEEIMGLCKKNGWSSPKVIFCTAFAPPEATKAVAAGGEGHVILGKPVSSEVLIASVRKHLPCLK